MKKLLLVCALILGNQSIKAQTYSYTFSGNANEELLSKLTAEVSALPQVKSCKINFKKEKEVGELIYQIQLLPMQGETNPNQFSFLFIKNIISENSLRPLQNNTIKL